MTSITALDLVRPCAAPLVPDYDDHMAPHVDVDGGTLGCALRCLSALLTPSTDRTAADAMDVLRRLLPPAPGESFPEVEMRLHTHGACTELHISEAVGDPAWLVVAVGLKSTAPGSEGRSTQPQLSLPAARLLVAVWVAFADSPRFAC
jgi:hypothetical protein